MIPPELFREIRRIQIATDRLAGESMAGYYHSAFKGRGMEFDEVREYLPGDDVRSIDWNVTARTGRPHVKKFVEEREIVFMLMLDISRSTMFGTVGRLKGRIAAEICSVLALSAHRNQDKVGLIAFTDRVEKFVPPGKGLRHVLRIVREALYLEPSGRGTDIAAALEYLGRVTTRSTVTCMLSDFYDPNPGGMQRALKIARRRHDLIALSLTDPMERGLPDVGLLALEDPETGHAFEVDTSSRSVQEEYAAQARMIHDARARAFRASGVDHVALDTHEPYVKPLLKFFRMRERRLKR